MTSHPVTAPNARTVPQKWSIDHEVYGFSAFRGPVWRGGLGLALFSSETGMIGLPQKLFWDKVFCNCHAVHCPNGLGVSASERVH
eukprot:370650-Amphidinium_carterae.1